MLDTMEIADANHAAVVFVEPRSESERACAERVSALLLSGAALRQDARRPSIYDLSDGENVYWVHMVEPGRALLLGCKHPDGGH